MKRLLSILKDMYLFVQVMQIPLILWESLYFKLGELDNAIAKFKEAVEVKPGFDSGLQDCLYICSQRRLYGSNEMAR